MCFVVRAFYCILILRIIKLDVKCGARRTGSLVRGRSLTARGTGLPVPRTECELSAPGEAWAGAGGTGASWPRTGSQKVNCFGFLQQPAQGCSLPALRAPDCAGRRREWQLCSDRWVLDAGVRGLLPTGAGSGAGGVRPLRKAVVPRRSRQASVVLHGCLRATWGQVAVTKNCQKLSRKENRPFCSASGLQFKRQGSLCSAPQRTSRFRPCNAMTLMSELAGTDSLVTDSPLRI